VIFTNPAGDILAYYPLSDAFTVTNISFRDFFMRAVTTKSPVLSDVFESATESKSKRIAYAVPVVGTKKEVVGVVVGGISLERLGAKLQKIADEKTGEYVMVVDRTGKRIIHPEKALVGQLIEPSHPISAGATEPTVTQSYTYAGRQALVAYGPAGKLGWTVAIQAPLAGILRSTAAASIVIFAVTGISLVLITSVVLIRRSGEHSVSVPPPERGTPAGNLRKKPAVSDTS